MIHGFPHRAPIPDMAKDIRIVYTPLHGTGNKPVRRVLSELGFTQVYVVSKQEEPDGSPAVVYRERQHKNGRNCT